MTIITNEEIYSAIRDFDAHRLSLYELCRIIEQKVESKLEKKGWYFIDKDGNTCLSESVPFNPDFGKHGLICGRVFYEKPRD